MVAVRSGEKHTERAVVRRDDGEVELARVLALLERAGRAVASCRKLVRQKSRSRATVWHSPAGRRSALNRRSAAAECGRAGARASWRAWRCWPSCLPTWRSTGTCLRRLWWAAELAAENSKMFSRFPAALWVRARLDVRRHAPPPHTPWNLRGAAPIIWMTRAPP